MTDQTTAGLAETLDCESLALRVEHRPAFMLLPRRQPAGGKIPWLWYAPTFDDRNPKPLHTWMFSRFLAAGIAIAGIDVGESYGNPVGRSLYTALHRTLTSEYGLAPQACLMPQSRGGLMLYNWAVEHPDCVACVAGIYTVCDLRSYPGLTVAGPAYGMSAEELALHLAEHNPLDRLAPLAAAGAPILHIHGDSDAVVPLEANSGALAARYAELGGQAQVLIVPGKGHQEIPEFFECTEVVEFVVAHTRHTAA